MIEHHHTETKRIVDRLSRIIGHIEAVKRMIKDERDCTEILIQLSAIDAAIMSCGRVILKDHIDHCIYEAVQHDDALALQDLHKAIDQFVK